VHFGPRSNPCVPRLEYARRVAAAVKPIEQPPAPWGILSLAMPARRRIRTRPKARPHKVKAGNAWVGVAVMLTRAEIQKLKDRAASDFRAVAAYA